MLRDLVLMAAAPERLELTSVSPQFREQLPALAKTIGRARLLQWQAQLRGTEQQLRQSVQPRLWLEVLLLGLLAEPVAAQSATAAPAPRQPVTTQPAAAASPPTTPVATPAPTPSAAAPAATPAIEAPTPSTKPAPPPSPELPTVSTPAPAASTNLPELWQQILGSLELPSTRMLLSQQAQLVRLDANRAVVQVAGNWMGMVQSRASLLEQAVCQSTGGSRQLVLRPATPPCHSAGNSPGRNSPSRGRAPKSGTGPNAGTHSNTSVSSGANAGTAANPSPTIGRQPSSCTSRIKPSTHSSFRPGSSGPQPGGLLQRSGARR